MNIRLNASNEIFNKTPILKTAIAILMLLFIRGISFGQAYSYTDVSVNGDSVIAYGNVTGYYNSSTHVSSTQVTLYSPSGRSASSWGGESASASLSINGEEGTFGAGTSHQGTCPG